MLDGITVNVTAGSLVQVRGENGSGKSTLLRLAAGFTRPTTGNVHRGYSSLGFVPDQAGMIGTLTARSYLSALARIRGLSARKSQSRIEELHERFIVRPGLDEPVAALSKGNRQKVLLMQAFLAPVDLIVMDEPTTALDEIATSALREVVSAAVAEGCGVLAATHGEVLDGLGTSHLLRDGKLSPTPERPEVGGAAVRVFVRLTGTGETLACITQVTGIVPAVVRGTVAEYTIHAGALATLLRGALDAGCEIVTVRTGEAS